MLTPKEKAEELYDSFFELYPNQDAYFIARECAKIAVEEILKEYSVLQIETSFCYKYWKYWKEVLTEIDKL